MREGQKLSAGVYGRFVIFIAGLGGLLYGIDVGIIAAALLYLSKTIDLTLAETSIIVAAVLGGSMLSSPLAGIFADWFGRKKIMVVSGLMFVASVVFIVTSQNFPALFFGRLLQGMSGGVIAVVVPLYLAESLSAKKRGQGTAIFQFMLTFGIVLAAFVGWFYTHQAEAAIAAVGSNAALVRAAQNHAWRGMFLAVVYPGLLFFAGAFFLTESPRWLFRRGKREEALRALRHSVSAQEAELELREMAAGVDSGVKQKGFALGDLGSLLKRKYVIPFILACAILSFNQATGINSVLGFLVVILKQAGMTATHATQGDVVVKVLNCVMTLVGVALVERKGRKFLLKLGTAGITVSMLAGGLIFLSFEGQRTDVKTRVEAARVDNRLTIPVDKLINGPSQSSRAIALTVLYSYGDGDHLTTVLNDRDDAALNIQPEPQKLAAPLTIKRAFYSPVPSEKTGWLVTACLAAFIAFYAMGPGVVVWLALSELLPMRIRSIGMGVALLLNQGVATLIAAVFLPAVGNYGYYAMFFFWSGCTLLYFAIAALFLPETKGKTLEEIEMSFEVR